MAGKDNVRVISDFRVLAANVCGWMDIGIVVAAVRAGALGVLNCESALDRAGIERALTRIVQLTGRPFGIKLDASFEHAGDLLRDLTPQVDTVIFSGGDARGLAEIVAVARVRSRTVLLEVTSCEEARLGESLGVDGLIAKGHEAGGRVGEETAFVLLQRLLSESRLPVWAHGGVGPHSAAACRVAGAAGVVLDSQLLLTPESTLPLKVRNAVERMEGDETLCLGQELGDQYRVYRRPGVVSVDRWQQLERQLAAESAPVDTRKRWQDALLRAVDWTRTSDTLWPVGQDGVLASGLVRRFGNVAGIVQGLRDSVRDHIQLSAQHDPLRDGAPLAQSHGTRFPVMQGPMTRVSDTAAFAEAVASGGGLPFLALALMRAAQVRPLLAETKQRLGNRPWGVGILGFVPPDLRAEQLEAVREVRPPFAIIAGGRPDQAAGLERDGTRTYLHVPTPALLRLFIQDGARRFIFEGRECGGHVGPRTSFVLWEGMIDALLEAVEQGVRAEELHIVFAGGIHDSRSAAMTAAMAGPLAARGARIGVLMGTAYLFTREAVASGAVVEGFQEEALRCQRTVLLETGPGHSTRCAETPFYETFRRTKRELSVETKTGENVREALEQLNLGRLRLASKGIARSASSSGQDVQYVHISPEQQRVDGMYMIGQVAALRNSVCSIQDLHEEACGGGSAHLHQMASAAKRLEVAADPRPQPPCDVAIIGMGCILPKAPHVGAFWANVLDKVDALTEVPKERFDINLYYDPDRQSRDKIYSRWGGFLDDVPFDPMRYGIPPAALGSIDPMQLLSLVVVDQALRDAGYADKAFARLRTSAIFGTSGGLGDLGGKYAVRSWLKQCLADVPEELLDRLPEWTEDSFPGLLPNVVAGRVANRFDLGGVNFTVDAACASSLAAAYLGVKELTAGTSDMVIAGGVDTVQNPFCFLCFAKSQALSPRGKCRPFDRSADGIAISEGITVLVMKRLADAERDGDRIYAVIKGIAGSSDGRGRSMTAPRPEGQKLVLRRAYEQAGFSPATVGLVEAHGTGTVAGDTAELASLSDVMREAGATSQSCAIGSVKSMLGHTKSAAGITGLMKVALALHHKVLTPTLHVESPNAKLREPGSPIFVNTIPQPWIPPKGVPRRAGVSSFGFGGTNFHAVLEEYQGELRDPADRAMRSEWPAELFLWNAPSAEALRPSLQMMARKIESGARPSLRELAAATCRLGEAGRRDAAVRLAIVATSLHDLQAKLARAQAVLAGGQKAADAEGIYLNQGGSPPKVAFLFPGQGSQKPRMLSELALHFPEFRRCMELAEQVLAGRLPQPLSSYVYPPPAFTAEQEREQMDAITDTVVAQPALGVMEAALAKLLKRLGVEPDMTAGHSYGEYTALWAAGVLPEEALIDLSEARGRSIKESVRGDMGTMAAVQGDAPAIDEVLRGVPGVIIANDNSPRQLVIAGPSECVQDAAKRLNDRGLPTKMLPVACAFHSELMQPARERLASALTRQSFSKPKLAVFSNTLGERYPEEPEKITALLVDHLVRPVKFTDEVRSMYQQGARLFVEVGPKGVLTGLARQTLADTDAKFVQVDNGDRNGLVQLLHVLAQLAAAGIGVEALQLFRGRVEEVREVEWLLAAEPAPQPVWLVNGGDVFPRNQRPQIYEPFKIAAKAESAGRVPSSGSDPHRGLANEPVPAAVPDRPNAPLSAELAAPPAFGASPTMPANMTSAPIPASYGNLEAVMLPFQQLMSQFLQTQAAIMTAYLQNAPVEGLPATPAPQAMQTVFVPAPLPAPTVPAMVARPQAEDPSTGQKVTPEPRRAVDVPSAASPLTVAALQRNVSEELVRIVSERTGYPVEMLALDASIEADLGIDSIKRVEILSTFQRLCSQSEQAVLQGMMEKLTSATTLREMVERIATVLEPPRASAAPVELPSEQPADTSPAGVTRDIAGELVRIVSERTGYPAEMLDLNAGIEADLGIDSIKRVEILSSFQRLCTAAEQAALQAAMEKLTSATTLGQIAEFVAAALALNPPAQTVEQKARPLPRCTPVVAARPRRGKQRHYPGRVCLITDDETGIAARIAEDLERAGEHPVLLRHSPDATLGANGVQSTDLRDPVAIHTLVEALRVKYGSIGAVIHLLPLRAEHSAQARDLADWRERLRTDVISLYALIRATEKDLQRTGREGGALLAAVTARGGDFGLRSGASVAPTHQAIADFLKSAALEIPEARTKIVDLDATDPVAVLHQKLMDELASGDDALQVGLPGDHRLVPLIQTSQLTDEPRVRMESDWVCLLTGGARGITAAIAQSLAQRCRPTLILVGTTPYPDKDESAQTAGIDDPARLKAALAASMRASSVSVKPADIESAAQRLFREREIRVTVQSLRQLGCRVAYHAVDVRDEAAFGALIDSIYTDYGRLDVVIHGAGIIEDKLIRDKTAESFERVLHTKADSMFILSRKLRPESLRCLLLMSSVTAAFGNRGQADYGAANGVLNGFALDLASRWPAHVVAVNWGPWDQSGMVSEQVRRQFLDRGVQPIAPAAGAEAALNEIEAGSRKQPAVVSGDGPWVKEAVSELAAQALTVSGSHA